MKSDESSTEVSAWETSFIIRLNAETNKINSFHEERHNECVEQLRNIETELSTVCHWVVNACKLIFFAVVLIEVSGSNTSMA